MEGRNQADKTLTRNIMDVVDSYRAMLPPHQQVFLEKYRTSLAELSVVVPQEDLWSYAIPITIETLRDLQIVYRPSKILVDDQDRWMAELDSYQDEGDHYVLLVDTNNEFKIVDGSYIADHYAKYIVHGSRSRHQTNLPLTHEERFVPYLPVWLEHTKQQTLQHRLTAIDFSAMSAESLKETLDIKQGEKIVALIQKLLKNYTTRVLMQDGYIDISSKISIGDYVLNFDPLHTKVVPYDFDDELFEVVERDDKHITLKSLQTHERSVLALDQEMPVIRTEHIREIVSRIRL